MPETVAVLADLADAATKQLGDRFEAGLLLCHVLKCDRSWLMAHADAQLDALQRNEFATLVRRRLAGEPVAYMLGRQGFWTLDLEVTPAVLIPRPETELLVDLALQRLPSDTACRVADLGTGSGAVALAIANDRPNAQVLATDASADALAVAQANAQRLGIGNVRFVQGDWCAALDHQTFDLIVSNPPYIESNDAHLRRGDLRHEPRMALASGKDGLDAIRSIVNDATDHLEPGGWLLFEHGWKQGPAACKLLQQAGYRDVFTAPDLEQRERVSGGRKH